MDLFAGGLGGFSWAGRELGYSTLGIEWCPDACATREAAGLATLQADVAALDPLDFAPATGVTGGPPCPTYSMAGKGAGRELTAPILAAFTDLAEGRDTRAERMQECYAILEPTAHLAVLPQPRRSRKRGQHERSPFYVARRKAREALRASRHADAARSMLVVEPLRWALALRPRWVACEQVPPVLPLWEAMAAALRAHGYWTWTGLLSSETFGVPQTRCRAFMLASLDGPVDRPPATHQRYIPPRRRDEATGGLFDLPEAGRIVAPEDRGLLPWVSMAQALQWPEGPSPSPSPSVTGGGGATGGVEVFASKGARARAAHAVVFRNNTRAKACERGADEPAPTITGGHDHNDRAWVLRAGTNANDASRPTDEPAPTLRFGARLNDVSWVRADLAACGCPEEFIDEGCFCACCHAHHDDPAGMYALGGGMHGIKTCPRYELTARDRAMGWVESRPATTVNGDPRISEPGHHDADVSGSQQANAVRVSLAEALVLQSFDPAYPVQGSKSAAFLQVGNAIPLLLALAVLRAVAPERADLVA